MGYMVQLQLQLYITCTWYILANTLQVEYVEEISLAIHKLIDAVSMFEEEEETDNMAANIIKVNNALIIVLYL